MQERQGERPKNRQVPRVRDGKDGLNECKEHLWDPSLNLWVTYIERERQRQRADRETDRKGGTYEKKGMCKINREREPDIQAG